MQLGTSLPDEPIEHFDKALSFTLTMPFCFDWFFIVT